VGQGIPPFFLGTLGIERVSVKTPKTGVFWPPVGLFCLDRSCLNRGRVGKKGQGKKKLFMEGGLGRTGTPGCIAQSAGKGNSPPPENKKLGRGWGPGLGSGPKKGFGVRAQVFENHLAEKGVGGGGGGEVRYRGSQGAFVTTRGDLSPSWEKGPGLGGGRKKFWIAGYGGQGGTWGPAGGAFKGILR